MAIETVEDLREHIALATRVELSTIPPYLFALYSIKDPESEAARLIASIVVEEMLHVCLTTNLLLAIGGEPNFSYDVIPEYPSVLAHHTPDLPLVLGRCTRDLVSGTFMAIESPRAPVQPPQDATYATLGQFYAALEQAIDDLDTDQSLFTNCQTGRQLSDPSFYAPVEFDAEDSGGLMLVSDGATADAALEIIIDQGEGLSDEKWADPSHQELTHFYKFDQIAGGTVRIGPVWPVRANPKSAEFPEPVAELSRFFNALYGLTFVTMGDLFSGEHDQRVVIDRLYTLMSRCMTPIAGHLVQQPVSNDEHAGPTFEIHRFGTDPWQETAAMAESIVEDYGELAGACAAVQTLRSGRRPV